jgi:glycosyltransferase involved in cell wall biosynthesis
MHASHSPSVVYWNNIPSPYMVERFELLARRGRLRFEAWFNARREPDRSWSVDESSWSFPFRYIPSLSLNGRVAGLPDQLLRRRSLDVLVSLYDQPSFVLGQLAARRRGIRTALWVETTFEQWVKRRAWKERLKRQLFSRADAILTTGPDGRSFALRYNASADRVHFVPHVIDAEHYRRGHAAAQADRDRRRDGLGLRGVTFLFVGRLWFGKGLYHLLEAFSSLQRQSDGEVSLLLVGDGVDEQRLRELSQSWNLRNTVFAGFKQQVELPRWYALADVFVFPTLGDPFGLVVEEAMACSLPVIATTSAGEITHRIRDGINGYLVPPGSGAALARRMQTLAADAALRGRMGAAGHRRVREQSHQQWAEAFEQVIQRLTAERPMTPP